MVIYKDNLATDFFYLELISGRKIVVIQDHNIGWLKISQKLPKMISGSG